MKRESSPPPGGIWSQARTVMLIGFLVTIGGCLTMLRSLNTVSGEEGEYTFIKGIIVPHIVIMVGLAVILLGLGLMVQKGILSSRTRTLRSRRR